MFIPKSVKRKYPFDEQEAKLFRQSMYIFGALSQDSKKSSLPFDYLDMLTDGMDRKSRMFP